MPYLILAKSRMKQGEMVALVDRTKFKDHFWTENVNKAIVFTSREAAEKACAKLKFNNPKVWDYENGKIRLGQVEVITQISAISKALERKNHEWHDDDWDEGKNA